jgi:hypothetical protein
MSEIAIDEARQIGEAHAKDIVVIVVWDAESDRTRIVTWDRDPQQKAAAAVAGERFSRALDLGPPVHETIQDCRTIEAGMRAGLVDGLMRANRAAEHALSALIACRVGPTDGLLTEIRDALRAAREAEDRCR